MEIGGGLDLVPANLIDESILGPRRGWAILGLAAGGKDDGYVGVEEGSGGGKLVGRRARTTGQALIVLRAPAHRQIPQRLGHPRQRQ